MQLNSCSTPLEKKKKSSAAPPKGQYRLSFSCSDIILSLFTPRPRIITQVFSYSQSCIIYRRAKRSTHTIPRWIKGQTFPESRRWTHPTPPLDDGRPLTVRRRRLPSDLLTHDWLEMRGNDVRHMPRPPQYPRTHTQYGTNWALCIVKLQDTATRCEWGIRIDNTLWRNERIRSMVGGGGEKNAFMG